MTYSLVVWLRVGGLTHYRARFVKLIRHTRPSL